MSQYVSHRSHIDDPITRISHHSLGRGSLNGESPCYFRAARELELELFSGLVLFGLLIVDLLIDRATYLWGDLPIRAYLGNLPLVEGLVKVSRGLSGQAEGLWLLGARIS